jgi:hypothetical protein
MVKEAAAAGAMEADRGGRDVVGILPVWIAWRGLMAWVTRALGSLQLGATGRVGVQPTTLPERCHPTSA